MRVSFKGKHWVNTLRVNNCLLVYLSLFTLSVKLFTSMFTAQRVNKQEGDYYIVPCLPRVFTLCRLLLPPALGTSPFFQRRSADIQHQLFFAF